MTYQAVVVRIKTRPHPNADKLLLGDCLGFQVVVGKDTQDGDLGVFFPADGQLSAEYAKANDLITVRDAAGKHVSGGFFGADRRVRAQSFRGERSEGYWAPVSSVLKLAPGTLREGDRLNAWQGIPLCEKYETEATKRQRERASARAVRENPAFPKHYDTENIKHLARLPDRAVVIVTEKIHGTSQRTGLIEEDAPETLLGRLWRKATGGARKKRFRQVTGSRNVTFAGPSAEAYRNKAASLFEGKLLPGEIVYYEIAGFDDKGAPIMHPQTTKKGFGDSYGPKMQYTYGCAQGEHKVFVYRMTRHQDGRVREYAWTEIAARCAEMGVQTVPLVSVSSLVPLAGVPWPNEGPSLVDPRHIREGVCVRFESVDSGRIQVFKDKSHTFGVLEGYLKDTGVADTEEAA